MRARGLLANHPVDMLAAVGVLDVLRRRKRLGPSTLHWDTAPDRSAPGDAAGDGAGVDTAGLDAVSAAVAGGSDIDAAQEQPRSGGWYPAHAVFSPASLTPELVAKYVVEDIEYWLSSPLLDEHAPSALSMAPEAAIEWIGRVVATGDPRLVAQLRAMIDCDVTRTSKSGKVRKTALDFTAGQIKFLPMVRELALSVTAEDVAAALRDNHAERLGVPYLRWSGIPNQPAAYTGVPPGVAPKPPRRVAVEWLAWLGVVTLPVREVELVDALWWVPWELPADFDGAAKIVSAAAPNGFFKNVGGGSWSRWRAPIVPSDSTQPGRYRQFGGSSRTFVEHDRDAAREAGWSRDTPVGIGEIAYLCGVKRATVDQWIFRGLLLPERWHVSGRGVWTVDDIHWWAGQNGRNFRDIGVDFPDED